jgi:hypothetical protein
MLAADTAGWVTAVGTVFASVGTVAAVIVALLVAFRRPSASLKVRCNKGPVPLPDGRGFRMTVFLSAVNDGQRSVRVNRAFFRFESGERTPMPLQKGTELPAVLNPEDEVLLSWDDDDFKLIHETLSLPRFTSCGFTDSLGNSYSAPFAGMKLSRTGWRRRKQYVAQN